MSSRAVSAGLITARAVAVCGTRRGEGRAARVVVLANAAAGMSPITYPGYAVRWDNTGGGRSVNNYPRIYWLNTYVLGYW